MPFRGGGGGGGVGVVNAQNLEKFRVKPTIVLFYCTLLPFFGCTLRIALFSRISPA